MTTHLSTPGTTTPITTRSPTPGQSWLNPQPSPSVLESGRSIPLSHLEPNSRPSTSTSRRSTSSRSHPDDRPESFYDGDSEAWTPHHPCYPHPNPYVPASSPLATNTKVIRIPRDYMYSGDLSPAFSQVYPEILEPYLSEERFREIVKDVNEGLRRAHDPWGWGNWVTGIVGVLTGWVWDEGVGGYGRGAVAGVEEMLKRWNGVLEEEEKRVGERRARLVELRRTGFLGLDVVIPDPEVGMEGDVGSVDGVEEERGFNTGD